MDKDKFDKIYELTLKNDGRCDRIEVDLRDHIEGVKQNRKRIEIIENKDKKTIKEHVTSFGKLSAAIVAILSLLKYLGVKWPL